MIGREHVCMKDNGRILYKFEAGMPTYDRTGDKIGTTQCV
jgi:hypothetical protein